jgi:hypothetical protein
MVFCFVTNILLGNCPQLETFSSASVLFLSQGLASVIFASTSYGPMFDEKLTHAAWKSKPSWHVVSTNDQTLTPAMEEAGAKKANGKVFHLPTCHVAMLQEPEKVADIITEAAAGARA